MTPIFIKTECEDCGGDAYQSMLSSTNEVIVEFMEETPFTCENCEKETYLSIDKRTY